MNLQNSSFKYPDTKAYNFVVNTLHKRGVTIDELAQLAFHLQHEFIPKLTVNECHEAIVDVMHKREFLNNAMVALELDRLAEEEQI